MLAKEYGVLPSYVQANATTFDLMVMDVMSTWEQYKQDKANGVNVPPQLTQEQMLAMLKRTRK